MKESNQMNFLIMTVALAILVNVGFVIYSFMSHDTVPEMSARIMKLEKMLEVKD